MDETATFYDELADDYTALYANWDGAVRRQGDAIHRLILAVARGATSTVLDATCGIGTQAIGLALAGHAVSGTDLSAAAIERARREARRFGVGIDLRVADVRTLADSMRRQFDVVVSLDNSLPHLTTAADLTAAMSSLRSVLRADGLLVVSTRDYDALLATRPPGEPPRMYDEAGQRRLVTQVWEWEPAAPVYRLHQFVLREGPPGEWSVRHLVAPYRAWTRVEMAGAAADAGFVDARWLEPDETDYFQPILVARGQSPA